MNNINIFIALNLVVLTLLTIYSLLKNNSGYYNKLNNLSELLVENSSQIFSTSQTTIDSQTNQTTETTEKSFNDTNTINSENVKRVLQIDDHLKKLSKFGKVPNSALIYPKQVFDMTNMIINKELCSQEFGKDLLLLVLVFNRVNGFERRQTIRETWGQDIKRNPKSKLYFTVGLSTNQTIQKRLEEEDKKYGDVIQFGYYESYYNCTIKVLGLLRWTSMSCPFVKYMLKVDDDVVLLNDNLIDFCRSTKADSIYGYLWENSVVIRGESKWSLSVEDYHENNYPNYIGGPYLIPGSKVLDLYETAITKSLPAVPYEDVFLTGIVANKLKIPRKKLSSLMYINGKCEILELDFCFYKNMTIFWQGLNDFAIRKVWQIYHNQSACPSTGMRC